MVAVTLHSNNPLRFDTFIQTIAVFYAFFLQFSIEWKRDSKKITRKIEINNKQTIIYLFWNIKPTKRFGERCEIEHVFFCLELKITNVNIVSCVVLQCLLICWFLDEFEYLYSVYLYTNIARKISSLSLSFGCAGFHIFPHISKRDYFFQLPIVIS